MKTIIFATTMMISFAVFAQDVGDAPMPEAPAVEMTQQEEQGKEEFLKPSATEEDLKEIQKMEAKARQKDNQLQRKAAREQAKLQKSKPKRAPASVNEPEFDKKKKGKKKKNKKKKKTADM